MVNSLFIAGLILRYVHGMREQMLGFDILFGKFGAVPLTAIHDATYSVVQLNDIAYLKAGVMLSRTEYRRRDIIGRLIV